MTAVNKDLTAVAGKLAKDGQEKDPNDDSSGSKRRDKETSKGTDNATESADLQITQNDIVG